MLLRICRHSKNNVISPVISNKNIIIKIVVCTIAFAIKVRHISPIATADVYLGPNTAKTKTLQIRNVFSIIIQNILRC